MADKKFTTYCRIIDYLDEVDHDLAMIIRGTCTDLALSSMKGKAGITFLRPEDTKFRKELADLAYSSVPAKANEATNKINALILRCVFNSTGDWDKMKSDIPNSLFPSQHVEVERVTAKEVIFKSGARAVLDEKFNASRRNKDIAVWTLVSGDIPVTKDKPATMEHVKKAMKDRKKARSEGTVVGQYEMPNTQSLTMRHNIALAVENTYVLHEIHKRNGLGYRNVYLEYTLNLIHYIFAVVKDENLLFDRVLPLLSFDKIDFYLLVEPHKFSGTYVINDMILNEWWTNKNMNINYKDVMNTITTLLDAGTGALVYTGRDKILSKLSTIRSRLMQQIIAKPRECVDAIEKFYTDFESSNTIEGLGPIYPAGIAAMYSADPGLKMIHDELRYLTYGAFKRLESSLTFDIGAYNEVLNMIAECLYVARGDARPHKMLNKKTIKHFVSPTDKINEIRIFVCSTMFMYIPLTEQEANNMRQKYSVSRPDPNDIVMFNISKDLYDSQVRLLHGSPNNDVNIVAALKSLDVNKLDPALREELRTKFG